MICNFIIGNSSNVSEMSYIDKRTIQMVLYNTIIHYFKINLGEEAFYQT